MNPWQADERASGSEPVTSGRAPGPEDWEEQLHLLALCVELQLDVLLVAMRGATGGRSAERSAAEASGGADPRWVGNVLDLTGSEPLPGRPAAEEPWAGVRGTGDTLADRSAAAGGHRDWLAARYAALVESIGELLAHPEVQRHPAVVGRLREARGTCDERIADLRGARRAAADAGWAGRPAASVARPLVEAGHFLG